MSTATVVQAIPETAIELFSPAEAGKFELMARGLVGLQRQIEGVTIARQKDANNVQSVLAEAKRALKTCEDTRLAQTKPLRDQEAAINRAWKQITEALDTLAKAATRKILGWNEQERQRQWREQEAARQAAEAAARVAEEARRKAEVAKTAAARAKAEEAARAAEQEAAQRLAAARETEAAIEEAPRGIRTDSGTTSTQWPWVFKVTDPQSVPREYLEVNEIAIRNAVRAGVREIEGVVIYQQEQLRTTTR